MLEAVKRDGGALQFASEELKKEFGKNRDIMLEVVKWNGNALRYASEELKKDRSSAWGDEAGLSCCVAVCFERVVKW
ncbi:DUF4116 domain-containing protein [Mycoplasmopsis cynos]|uniref:DUF4116 domain-containing protein n=1 Tax=Mycoplasmopsis cynos TaxID=171284 RepID=UPI0022035278|nr:DUF4116 domain-containing protein [Mycoplasmopsis cynos]UWV82658.1 DUF4116 domain-containing protein [Mycoplasmopsis cynos]